MQAAVMGPVQTFAKTASINERGLGEELAAALGPHRVCMLKSHGAVTVGAEWAPAMDGFDRPALVLWGADDPYAQAVPFAENMARRLGGRAVLLAGCGHWWPAQRPAEVAAELDRLWSEAS